MAKRFVIFSLILLTVMVFRINNTLNRINHGYELQQIQTVTSIPEGLPQNLEVIY